VQTSSVTGDLADRGEQQHCSTYYTIQIAHTHCGKFMFLDGLLSQVPILVDITYYETISRSVDPLPALLTQASGAEIFFRPGYSICNAALRCW
jgi:hypothetical protein